MHTEHLENVRIPWVVTGWLVAIAVTSLVVIALAGLGILGRDLFADMLWGVFAVAIGFWVGGFFLGFKSLDAPLLHAVGMGVTSLVAWFLVNLGLVLAFPGSPWQGLPPTLTAAVLVIQMGFAIFGAWIGHRIALAGGPEPEEGYPE